MVGRLPMVLLLAGPMLAGCFAKPIRYYRTSVPPLADRQRLAVIQGSPDAETEMLAGFVEEYLAQRSTLLLMQQEKIRAAWTAYPAFIPLNHSEHRVSSNWCLGPSRVSLDGSDPHREILFHPEVPLPEVAQEIAKGLDIELILVVWAGKGMIRARVGASPFNNPTYNQEVIGQLYLYDGTTAVMLGYLHGQAEASGGPQVGWRTLPDHVVPDAIRLAARLLAGRIMQEYRVYNEKWAR